MSISKLKGNDGDRRSAAACSPPSLLVRLWLVSKSMCRWLPLRHFSALSLCPAKEEKPGPCSNTGILGLPSHRLTMMYVRLIASCGQTARLSAPTAWGEQDESTCRGGSQRCAAPYVFCVCLREGLHEFKCLQMFARPLPGHFRTIPRPLRPRRLGSQHYSVVGQ